MEGQMSIFDFIPPPTPKGLEDLPEDEMVRLMCEGTGLDFKPIGSETWLGKERYEAKRKGEIYAISYMIAYSYKQDKKVKSIACSYDYGNGGCGTARDNLEEAIDFFKRRMKVVDETV